MRVFLIATTACLLTACPKPPTPEAAATAGGANSKAADPTPATEAAQPPESKPPPLSDEDKRLIALDPSEITPELRRKRAYALRRQAMQDPNSPLARTLDDLQKASQNGEIDPNGGAASDSNGSAMPTFTVDGKPPTSGKGPAGTRMGPAGAGTPAE